MYPIYDPERCAVGHKHVLWQGMYGNDREAGLAAFVERLPTLAPALAWLGPTPAVLPCPLDLPHPVAQAD